MRSLRVAPAPVAAGLILCACAMAVPAATPAAPGQSSASSAALAPPASSSSPSSASSSTSPSLRRVQAAVHLLPDRPLQLGAVAMAGSQHAWIGGNGAVFGTADGGVTWTRLYTGAETIGALDFLDAQHGWAVGGDALLGTSDGGHTWQPLGEPAGATLRAVDFVAPAVGYGVTAGNSGSAVRTADGGRTWTALAVPGSVQSVCFVNAENGFALRTGAAGQPAAEVLATGDGGVTWRKVLAPQGIYPQDVASAQLGCSLDGGVWALLVSWQGMNQAAYGLYRSADGGAAWTVVAGGNTAGALLWQTAPSGVSAPVPGPGARLATLSGRTAVLLGNCPVCNGAGTVSVARTTDGGRTWHAAQVPGLPAIYGGEAIAFADADHGLLVAAPRQGETEVLATTDGGATWARVFDREDPAPADAISFVSAQVGYGLGSSADPAAILRTADGGASWTAVGDVPGGKSGSIYGQDVLAFTDAAHGWAVTAAQTLVRTADGGRSWVPASIAAGAGAIAGVAFADARHGCVQAAGRAGALWSTSDGGATWSAVSDRQAQAMRSAAGLSGPEALLCASAAANPGWIASGAPVGSTALAGALDGRSRWLWFADDRTNVFGLLATHDGGRSWTQYLWPDTVNQPRSVSFLDAQHGWLLTQGDDRVLRTTDGGATWTQVA